MRRCVLLMLLVWNWGAMGWSNSTPPTTLTILHTNDTYGQLEPLVAEDGGLIGGVLRRAALIHQIRQGTDAHLLLDAGDALGPHPLARFDQGETATAFMNQMGYHAMAVGNHELGEGIDILQQRMAQAYFPMLCANVRLKASGEWLTRRFVIQEVAGMRVGIFGLIDPSVQTRILARLARPLEVLDPIPISQAIVTELKASGCQLIIALTQLGYRADLRLIGQVKGIHLIIGSEVTLPESQTIAAMLPVEAIQGTTLVYCPWRGTHLGRVDVHFGRGDDGAIQIESVIPRQYRLDETVPLPRENQAWVAEMETRLNRLVQQYQVNQAGVIGRVMPGEQISTLDLIPWVLREHVDAEVALLNLGSLTPLMLQGEIQRQQIMESIRFGSYVTILDLTGAQLRAALAHSASQTAHSRALLHVGVDVSGKTVNGRPIHLEEVYSVATNDFLASGGDGYAMLKQARRIRETDALLSQAVIDFLRCTEQQPLTRSCLQRELDRTVWKSKARLDVMFQGSHVSDAAENYPLISELKSQSTGTFGISGMRVHFSTSRATPHYGLELKLDSQYRRLRHPETDDLELIDSTKASAILRYAPSRTRFVPLFRAELEDIEWTQTEASRPVAFLGGAVESKMTPEIKWSLGLVFRRPLQTDGSTELDLDVRAEWQRRVRGIQLVSSLQWLPTFTSQDERPLRDSTTRLQATATLPLRKKLSLNASWFLYRDTRLGPYASTINLAVQWGFTWGKKP